jgi:hypothetical protein
MLKKLTLHHALEVTTILRQVYLDAALHVVDILRPSVMLSICLI